jgi:hypothetical protein
MQEASGEIWRTYDTLFCGRRCELDARRVEFETEIEPDVGLPPVGLAGRGLEGSRDPTGLGGDRGLRLRRKLRRHVAERMSFRQIPDSVSEPLRPIAVMRLEPDDFASRFGIDFEEGSADLDFTRSALIELESGLVAGLVRYARSPQPGTEVHDPEQSTDPPVRAP